MQKENKEKEEQIQWRAIYPNSPIQEGQYPICGGVGFLIGEKDGYTYKKTCVCEEKRIAMQKARNSRYGKE